MFVLGSEESGWTTGTINDGVHAEDPASVQIHFATINGGIDIHRGSGPFGPPFGFIRNHVKGTVELRDNVLEDPDGNEYVTNTISGSLHCSGNDPAPQIGDSEGLPNVVTGQSAGQCADL